MFNISSWHRLCFCRFVHGSIFNIIISFKPSICINN
nr:MAG TPA: hypothetical protein [Caudoviricetes sp.]